MLKFLRATARSAATLTLTGILFLPVSASARTEVSDDGNTVQSSDMGENEAQRFFRPNRRPTAAASGTESGVKTGGDSSASMVPERQPEMSSDTHYLAIHLGGFLSSDAYQWSGTPHVNNTGNLTAGLTYRMAPLGALADWAWRADFIGYTLPEGKALQMAILPILLFPDSASRFPLYFGAGAGVGLFPTQLPGKSVLGIHYQLLAGVRFFNVLGNTGFFLESGLKNHFFLLSDGQFNGLYLTVGTLFTF